MIEEALPVPENLAACNSRRLMRHACFRDPLSGLGCLGERFERRFPTGETLFLPVTITADPAYTGAGDTPEAVNRVRLRHDFEFWAATCCHIRDKSTGEIIPFRLNFPQVKVLAILEADRLAGNPMRLIMLKARQWGGSTLVQMYMAWIQCTIRRNWNSLICAHVKDTAASIRGIYSTMLGNYPSAYWDGDDGSRPVFRAFERAANVREIAGRGCLVTLGSSENAESVRGADYAMAHLSEVAFWADSRHRSPADLVRAVCGAINRSPLTLIVMESTANGVGNFFHNEWCRAEKRESDKVPVFIPWFDIPIYSTPLPSGADPADIYRSFDPYERSLWHDRGLSLEQVLWYHLKRREYQDHAQMKAEYPSSPSEAFANTGFAVFNPDDIDRLRHGCRPPVLRGEFSGFPATGPDSLKAFRISPRPDGEMCVWAHPAPGTPDRDRYLVTVDIGGRSLTSDYSVIAVFDRRPSAPDAALEVVAQWRGHCDHDTLAWRAAAIARHYHEALLVFESNTLETDNTEGDPAGYILQSVSRHYHHLYRREKGLLGFHTNRATKSAAITALQAALRDSTLLERDVGCCNELLTFRNNPDGSQSAASDSHDDILITRAIALLINLRHLPYGSSKLTAADIAALTRR